MVEIEAFGFSIEFGLHLIEQSANLTFIFFLGVSLLAALGLRFSYYANENMRRTAIDSQKDIWAVFRYIGLFAAMYSMSWILDIVSSLSVGAKNGLLLAMALALVVSLREIARATGREDVLGSEQLDTMVSLGFVVAIVLFVLAVTVVGQNEVTALFEGLIGIGLVSYGFALFQQQVSATRLQGTMLDSLIRHLFPVLVFASLVSIVQLVIPAGIDPVIALHIQVVFLIMTATSLMTATIKLRQNLAAL